MNKRPNLAHPAAKSGRGVPKKSRPFWLPAPGYYVLSTAVAIAIFFFLWEILREGNEETPWIWAGIGASVVLGGAVYLREFVFRNARARFLLARRMLDSSLDAVAPRSGGRGDLGRDGRKLTLEMNAAIVREIQKKSDAARVLEKLPDGHREVFEVCDEYLSLNSKELATVRTGSPRLAALRRGREVIGELHRLHLLQWAEIEARALTRETQNLVALADKIDTAQKALSVLDSALHYYPEESHLVESKAAIVEFIASVKISHWIEQAERAAFKGDFKRALSHYRDALFYLGRENVRNEERALLAAQINDEIQQMRRKESKKKRRKLASKNSTNLEGRYD